MIIFIRYRSLQRGKKIEPTILDIESTYPENGFIPKSTKKGKGFRSGIKTLGQSKLECFSREPIPKGKVEYG
jgi:hypothetical protein